MLLARVMRGLRFGWHTWHTTLFLVLAAWGCGGKASSGSAGSSGLNSCESNLDCASGTCIEGQCAPMSGTGGSSGARNADAGTTVAVPGAGCGGTFVFMPPPGGTGGTGGVPQQAPTCTVDAGGFATTTLDVLCDVYRCPAHAADLVQGLDCSEIATEDAEGIIMSSGCGFDTLQISGTGFTYRATFDATQAVLTALEVKQESPWDLTGCTAYGYTAGEPRPACPSETRYRCVRPTNPEDPEPVCREPGQEGCAACCTPWSSGNLSGCTVATSSGPTKRYDMYWGDEATCACNCPPCAQCTTESEYLLRVLPEMPECDCPPPPVGTGGSGTGGAAGAPNASPCELHCSWLNQLLALCPDVPR